ncbi:MAG: hypothetical protein ACPGTO_09510 [Polaribacter sp.]
MRIDNYINDLLYRYDCVIVPDFGGFITNKIGTKINHFTHTFYPPTKQISFNSHVKHNDGLLANYIASVENISFEKATATISLSVTKWIQELQSKSVELEGIGSLHLNENKKIIFKPNTTVNYLTASFGLATISSSLIKRHEKPLVAVAQKEKRKGVPVFIKHAAAAAILLSLGFLGYKGYEKNEVQKKVVNQQKVLEQKIQTATFVISNPLPTVELNIVKKVSKPYHIIAGAFQFSKNAAKKVEQLKREGYTNAKIRGVNRWGLTQVSFDSYSDRSEAFTKLGIIRETVAEEAWIFIEK